MNEAREMLKLAKQLLGRRDRGEPLEFQLDERKFMKAAERVLEDLELTVEAGVDADVHMTYEGTPDGWINPGESPEYEYEVGGVEMEYIKPNDIPIKKFLRMTQKYYKMPNISIEKIEDDLVYAFESLSERFKPEVYCYWETSGRQEGDFILEEPVVVEFDGDTIQFTFENSTKVHKRVARDVASSLSEYEG